MTFTSCRALEDAVDQIRVLLARPNPDVEALRRDVLSDRAQMEAYSVLEYDGPQLQEPYGGGARDTGSAQDGGSDKGAEDTGSLQGGDLDAML